MSYKETSQTNQGHWQAPTTPGPPAALIPSVEFASRPDKPPLPTPVQTQQAPVGPYSRWAGEFSRSAKRKHRKRRKRLRSLDDNRGSN